MPKKITFMDTTFMLSTRAEVCLAIDEADTAHQVRVATLNPEFMLEAQHNPDFREALGEMSHCIIDGFGLAIALNVWRLVHRAALPIEHTTGADLVATLFKRYSDGSRRFFLLGGTEEVNGLAQENVQKQYPKISLTGISGGSIPIKNITLSPEVSSAIAAASSDIVLVGFGAPKQELWITAASTQPIPVMIGVGGTFGFYSTKKRAPRLYRVLKIEWLYRGLTEKGHWKRLWRAVVIFPISSTLWTLGIR
jgi:N-acetylglucosaminyldiphosphoundecaprenol N-acetyl-beta-D-mannosaminyltransferase